MNTITNPTPYAPIATLHSCFHEKFGVPRQSRMMSEAKGYVKLKPDPRFRDSVRHLEDFSHIWIIYEFHRNLDQGWRPVITPPRLDAPNKVGVFASRSPHRPNPIGLSVVELERIDRDAEGGIEIHVSGLDILDGTPVIDLKPYVPYVDSVPDATGGWTETEIRRYPVGFSEEAQQSIIAESAHYHGRFGLHLLKLIEQMLEYDPRPTPQRETMPIEDPASEGREFAFRVFDLDVKWEIRSGGVWVRNVIRG